MSATSLRKWHQPIIRCSKFIWVGPKINFPLRTPNKFNVFSWVSWCIERRFCIFLSKALIIKVCWQFFRIFFMEKWFFEKSLKFYFSKKWGKIKKKTHFRNRCTNNYKVPWTILKLSQYFGSYKTYVNPNGYIMVNFFLRTTLILQSLTFRWD